MHRTRPALRHMAREDPELAARLILQTLPAAAGRIPPPLRYDLSVADMGTWRVSVEDGGGARVERRDGADGDRDGQVDFALSTDPTGLAAMAAGASPPRLMLRGRGRIHGKRRRAAQPRARAAGDGG